MPLDRRPEQQAVLELIGDGLEGGRRSVRQKYRDPTGGAAPKTGETRGATGLPRQEQPLQPSTDSVPETPIDLSEGRTRRLRRFNLAMGSLHLASGLLMVLLGNDFAIEVGALALNGPPGTPLGEGRLAVVGEVPLAWGTASFLFLSAIFHLAVAVPPGAAVYAAELRQGRNRFRWVEYSLSSTLMIVLIALITGVNDLAALVAIGFANVAMILFGWVMEMVNTPGRRPWWGPFWFGCIAGIGPWVAIFGYLAFNVTRYGGQGPPGFVYGILASIFVFFNCFALNQWLQYRGRGRWSDYLFGEMVYIVLSLTAKSALAWQIFANTLMG